MAYRPSKPKRKIWSDESMAAALASVSEGERRPSYTMFLLRLYRGE